MWSAAASGTAPTWNDGGGTLSKAFRLVLGLWILASMGCDDTLTGARPRVISDYSTPTLALETLAKGLEDKGATNGQDAYMGAFAESTLTSGDGRAFHAFFDNRDLRENPAWDPDQDWGKERERMMYAYLVRLFASKYEVTWEPYAANGNETGTPNDSLLHRKYRVVQLIRTGSMITRSPVAVGAADLRFVRSSTTAGKWVIATWQDYHTPDADSAQVSLGGRRLQSY